MKKLLKSVNNAALMTSKGQLSEGRVPIEILITLDRILAAGKITDNAQKTVVALMLQSLDEVTLASEYNFAGSPTSGELIQYLDVLTDEEMISIVEQLAANLAEMNVQQLVSQYDAQRVQQAQ